MKDLQAIVRALTAPAASHPRVLATLVAVSGSSYRRPGARLLIEADGQRIGSISGGCLEEDVAARAKKVAANGSAELITYDTSAENDLVWGVGLGCHGVVQILLEKLPARPAWVGMLAANLAARRPTALSIRWRDSSTAASPLLLGTQLAHTSPTPGAENFPDGGIFTEIVAPPPSLVIFGAGDDAQPLCRFAKELGWHVIVADPRAVFATPARFPAADAVLVAPAADLADRAAPEAGALAVVMTHHYVHDLPILGQLLPRPLSYLGLLGPKKRSEKILADLHLSPDAAQRTRLHAPVGLDLGAETPEEVALSILAEMCATLNRRDARPLRDRRRPIHG